MVFGEVGSTYKFIILEDGTWVGGRPARDGKWILLSGNRPLVSTRSQPNGGVHAHACQPFGWVCLRESGYADVFWARQIHRGESGRKPPVKRDFRFVKTATGCNGWARLAELAKQVSMPACEVLARYWGFLPAPVIDLIFAEDAEEVRGMRDEDVVKRIGKDDLRKGGRRFFRGEGGRFFDELDKVWVREGWVSNVLRLHSFDYIPDVHDSLQFLLEQVSSG